MDKWIFEEDKVTQGIVALQKVGRIPTVTINPASAVLKRHQKKCYASAVQCSTVQCASVI
ncbi:MULTISPECIES: hypothetical protein [Klebsiella]|uniref:hypothetical protein n=1 Tax=Klebsiella TaxID=570 RepID=UPI001CCCAD71|nr:MULTISPECIES: hypothetical protein [Klebsiella]MDQ2202679.1 hypothetical protein [Klebsiella pasteurii]